MTMGFGPFELSTRGLLQKGQDHSPPKVCFEEPSFWLAHSAINIQITNKLGVGLNGWSYHNINLGNGRTVNVRISASYRVILMERLGGLFFDGEAHSHLNYECEAHSHLSYYCEAHSQLRYRCAHLNYDCEAHILITSVRLTRT